MLRATFKSVILPHCPYSRPSNWRSKQGMKPRDEDISSRPCSRIMSSAATQPSPLDTLSISRSHLSIVHTISFSVTQFKGALPITFLSSSRVSTLYCLIQPEKVFLWFYHPSILPNRILNLSRFIRVILPVFPLQSIHYLKRSILANIVHYPVYRVSCLALAIF